MGTFVEPVDGRFHTEWAALLEPMSEGVVSVQAEAGEWKFEFLSVFEVQPNVEEDGKVVRRIQGGALKIQGDIRTYFGGLFVRGDDRYPILTNFRPDGGKQQNPIRTLVAELAAGAPAVRRKAAKELAIRLADATPGNVKEGLFATMVGVRDGKTRVVLWRFSAGASLRLVDANDDEDVHLEVDLKTFTKQSKQFKASMFDGKSPVTDFWSGRLRDNQVHETKTEHAQYWVRDFLLSTSAVTDIRGTQILTRAVRAAIKETTGETRDQLIQAAKLVQTQKAKPLTIDEFVGKFLDEEVGTVVLKHTPPDVRASPFTLQKDIVSKKLGMKRVIVDDAIHVKAPIEVFESRVKMGEPDAKGVRDITIRGRITRQDLQPME
jgi:hypothetical protein